MGPELLPRRPIIGTAGSGGGFQCGQLVCQSGSQPAMRTHRAQALGHEAALVPGCRTRLEADMVAFKLVLGSEAFQEGHAATQFGQARQAALQFARRQVVQHVRTDQQVHGRTRAQLGEVAEVRVVQVAARAM